MEAKKMTKKETLIYTLKAAELFSQYLRNKREGKPNDKIAIRKKFKDYDPKIEMKSNIPSLSQALAEELLDCVDHKDTNVSACYKRYSSTRDKIQKELDKTSDSLSPKVNKVLKKHKLTIMVKYWTDTELRLSHPDEWYTYAELYNYNNENPTRLYIRNTSSTSFDKAADCKKVAALFKDVAKMLESPTIQKEIVDIWKNTIADIESIKERRQILSEQYEKDVCSIAYQQLRTFARGILDFDLPETM